MDLSFLCIWPSQDVQDGIVEQKGSSAGSKEHNVEKISAGGGSETLTCLWNDVAGQMLQILLGYDPKRNDGSYMKGTILSSATLDIWVATTVQCLANKKKRGIYR